MLSVSKISFKARVESNPPESKQTAFIFTRTKHLTVISFTSVTTNFKAAKTLSFVLLE